MTFPGKRGDGTNRGNLVVGTLCDPQVDIDGLWHVPPEHFPYRFPRDAGGFCKGTDYCRVPGDGRGGFRFEDISNG
jgi:hypothetical protein